MRSRFILFVLAAVILCAGCASDGSFSNPFETATPTPGGNYYFGEFSDVPIPNDMSESSGDTFVTAHQSGIKSGVQKFSGRVDAISLIKTMRRNMADHGWVLRSLLRSTESVLVFEKPEKICSIQISDGTFSTSMRIFLSPRLDGDSMDLDISAYSAPAPNLQEQSLNQ